MLANLCKGLLEKNYELYLKHESMLEEEKDERQKLAQNFQDQMREVTQELEIQKRKRVEELGEN
jgi:polyhydroxyalkanoate synthesis regulator phasin